MKLKVGGKYVPHQKTVFDRGLENSNVFKRAIKKGQPYLFYVGFDSEVKLHLFNDVDSDIDGDYFSPKDVKEYDENKSHVFF